MTVKQHNAMLLLDSRVGCYSFMTALSTQDYLAITADAASNKGGLPNQRDALKTTTAKRIRARMVSDIVRGAILPPVVVGLVISKAELDSIPTLSPDQIIDLISGPHAGTIAIIDGMQRTAALNEAMTEHANTVQSQTVRMECWIASSTDSLIYRMLVLNTGQVPWNVSRQIQVVYAPLMEEMKKQVTFERVLDENKPERRTKAGEYAPSDLVELYVAFGLRKTDVNTQENLADEFSRLDIVEAIAEDRYNKYFYPTLQLLVNLDKAFSRVDAEIEKRLDAAGEEASAGFKRLRKGKNIFDGQPARIGFVVAVAVAVLGRVGGERDEASSTARMLEIQEQLDTLIAHLSALNVDELTRFLELDVLSERLYTGKRSAVGRHERTFFDAAFRILIDEKFNVPNLLVLWRA